MLSIILTDLSKNRSLKMRMWFTFKIQKVQYDTYNYSIANEKNISLIIKLHFSDTPLLGNMHVFFAQFCPSKPNPHFLCLNNNDSSVSDSDFLWFLLLRFFILHMLCCLETVHKFIDCFGGVISDNKAPPQLPVEKKRDEHNSTKEDRSGKRHAMANSL